MITVGKVGNLIIGNYKVFITNDELCKNRFISNYVTNKLLAELKKEDNSEMFTYKILKVSGSDFIDLFGREYEVIFEFVPNSEIAKEIKTILERLQIGL
jgi:hypothetical protein